MNGWDVLLAALVIAFAFIAWLCFQDFDRWVHYETETERGPSASGVTGVLPPGRNCEMDEKVALIKRVAEFVGVDLGDVLEDEQPS